VNRRSAGAGIEIAVALIALLWLPLQIFAQEDDTDDDTDPSAVIEASENATADADIERRLRSIYTQIEPLSNVDVRVQEGVIFLSGSVSNDEQARRALNLAARLEGVVTVDDDIDRTLDVQGNVAPIIEQFNDDVGRWLRALPLFLLAVTIFLVISLLGHQLAKWNSFWNRVSPNPFLGELLAQAVRIIAILVGLIIALNLLGASAMIGTILGGAGVVGLAIGFAVRDSLENYISSIMLSLRQPFRANDHVVIGDYEGKVVRLTSRATILMTMDGNHLRIPNSTVFKAVILNYSSNPERRFEFELGVDAADDPVAAMATGLDAIRTLPFVLDDPEPTVIIKAVGDSNIVLCFMGWINQDASDFWKSRSLAIRAAKEVLEDEGFTLPEPIYRLRFDNGPVPVKALEKLSTPARRDDGQKKAPQQKVARADYDSKVRETLDVTPDRHLESKVTEERAQHRENDLLDQDRPVE
jgi:small-conductance mechanosensitive channel